MARRGGAVGDVCLICESIPNSNQQSDMRLPDEMSRAVDSAALEIKEAGRGVLVLSGKPVEHATKPENRREFIDRVFSIPGLSGLALGARQARLRFAPGAGSTPELLRRLATAMRADKVEHFALADLDLIEVLAPESPVDLWRAGNRLTFLRIQALSP